MYNPGDTVVCVGMGIGKVLRIEKKDIGQQKCHFYIIQDLYSSMTMMVPTKNQRKVRPLSKKNDIEDVYTILKNYQNLEICGIKGNRLGLLVDELKEGSIQSLAQVIKSLCIIQENNELKQAEKRLLNECKGLLIKEIALTINEKTDHVRHQIETLLTHQ